MENNEKKGRINKKVLSIIILLILMIIILVTYLTYNKQLSKNIKNKNDIINESTINTKDNTNKEEIITTNYNYTNIKEYWINFRKAILSKNYEEINNYVNFPLQTRGPYDSDQIININKEQFETTFNKYLNEEDGLGETNKIWIEKNEMPEEINNENDNTVRLGNMIIKKDNNYWKLSFIYTNID